MDSDVFSSKPERWKRVGKFLRLIAECLVSSAPMGKRIVCPNKKKRRKSVGVYIHKLIQLENPYTRRKIRPETVQVDVPS